MEPIWVDTTETQVWFTLCITVLDHCQYGSRWRKRTGILAAHVDALDLGTFTPMRRGRRGLRARKSLPHKCLSEWTSAAQRYSERLKQLITKAHQSSFHALMYNAHNENSREQRLGKALQLLRYCLDGATFAEQHDNHKNEQPISQLRQRSCFTQNERGSRFSHHGSGRCWTDLEHLPPRESLR